MKAYHLGLFFGATVSAATLHNMINLRGADPNQFYQLRGADLRGAIQIITYRENKEKDS